MAALLNAPAGMSPALPSLSAESSTPVPVVAASAGVDLALQLEEQRRQQKQQQFQLELQIQQLQRQLQAQQAMIQQQSNTASATTSSPTSPLTPAQNNYLFGSGSMMVTSSSPFENVSVALQSSNNAESFADMQIGLTPLDEISSPSGDFDTDILINDFNPSSSVELFLRSTAQATGYPEQRSLPTDDLILHLDPQPPMQLPLSPQTINFAHSEHSSSSDNSPDQQSMYISSHGDRYELTSNSFAVLPPQTYHSPSSSLSNSGNNTMTVEFEEIPAQELRTSSFFASSPSSSTAVLPTASDSMKQDISLPQLGDHPALALMPVPSPAPNKSQGPSCSSSNEGLRADVDIDKLADSVDRLVICPSSGKQVTPKQLEHYQQSLVEKGGENSFNVCQSKMGEMMWRLADKSGQSEYSPQLGTVFQKFLSVMMPTVALFDVTRHQMDFSAIALRLKIALQMTADMQQPAIICHARTILYVNEKMHEMTGGIIAARAHQTSAPFYDFDIFHPEDAVRYFSLTLDKIMDKKNDERLIFRIVSAASPRGYVTCVVSHSLLFEQFTAMPMFSMLTFTRVDDITPANNGLGAGNLASRAITY